MSFVTDGECIESQKHIIQQNIKSLAIMKTFRFFAMALAAALTFAACNPEEKKDDGKLYRITVTAGENGTATASRTEAEAGDNITLTATPADGFAFEAWTVTSGNASVADATAASTTFTMPAGDVAISAAFKKAEEVIDDTEDILPLIEDSGFKAYVKYRMDSGERIENTAYPAWDRNFDGKLTAAEAAEVKAMNLTLFADDIYSLDGLQYFKNTEILIMDGVYAESGLEYISKLEKLKVFKANGAYLGDLDFSGCPDLNTVVCEEAYLSGINVSSCKNLVELNIYYTDVDGALDLSACTLLTSVDVCLTVVSKIDVSGCVELQKLDASSCSSLEELILPAKSKLNSLAATKTRIASVDLSGQTELTSLSVSNNRNLKGLDISKCTKLRTLYCMYSPIGGKLDLSNSPQMQELYADNCHLTEVDFSGCSKLWEIYVGNNNLSTVDVSQCGFYIDEDTGELTNRYTYRLGAQVEPGTEPCDDNECEINYKAWAGLDPAYPGVKPREVTIILREEQREYWAVQSNAQQNNNNYNGDNLGHVKEVIFVAN